LLLPDPSEEDADRPSGAEFSAQPVISDAAMTATASIPLERPRRLRTSDDRCSLQSIPIERYRFMPRSRLPSAYDGTIGISFENNCISPRENDLTCAASIGLLLLNKSAKGWLEGYFDA
jgi:hypothetical protein